MHLSVSRRGSTEFWHLKRPERLNALGPTLGKELLDALQNLQKDLQEGPRSQAGEPPACRSLMISAEPIQKAEGIPIWIAGGDLKELSQLKSPREGRSYAWLLAELCLGLEDLPIPVVAMIDGAAIGGGVELALAADLRIASARSAFHFKQLEVGLATGYGSCQRLISLLGRARATDLLLRCRMLNAQEALALGLVNEVAADEVALLALRDRILGELEGLSAEGLRAQKFMLQQPAHDARGPLIQGELDAFEALWMQPAHARFLQRYAPQPKADA